jgi:phospholipase C
MKPHAVVLATLTGLTSALAACDGGATIGSGTTHLPGTPGTGTSSPTAGSSSSPISGGTASPGSGATPAPTTSGPVTSSTSPIKHIVVIIQENRTFDNIFHGFTEPSGAIADYATTAVDKAGDTIPLASEPLAGPSAGSNGHADFLADYDDGKLDGFYDNNATYADGLPASAEGNFQVSYIPQTEAQPYWDMATQGSLAQRFFHGLTGGTEPSHMIFNAGSSTWDGNPDQRVTDNADSLFGCSDPDHATDTFTTLNSDGTAGPNVDSCFKGVGTIEDLLAAAGHSWRFYSELQAVPVDGQPTVAQDVINSISVYQQIYDGPGAQNLIFPETRILADVTAGTLADVTFVTPNAANSDHPEINAGTGPSWVTSVVDAIGESPFYSSTAIFVTWDDWGGFYDHVPPPQKYAPYGLGFRIPLICISPYAKHGQLINTQLEPGSLIKYIEETFGLPSLGTEDSTSNSASVMLDTTQAPGAFTTVAAKYPRRYFELQKPTYGVIDTDEYGPPHGPLPRRRSERGERGSV